MKKTIVLDTNVIVSVALLSRSTVRFIFDKARLSYQLCTSDACFQELSEVIMRPKFRKYLSVDNAQAFLDELKQKVSFVPITHTVNDCRDPKDNKFLELALSSSAQ